MSVKETMRLATQKQFLESGFELLKNPDARLESVKLTLVAEHIGRSVGGAYNIWPKQEDYWRSLTDHTLAPRYDVTLEMPRAGTPTLGERQLQWADAWITVQHASEAFYPRRNLGREAETLEGAPELFDSYYARQAGIMAQTLSTTFDTSADATYARSLVHMGEDIISRISRRHIEPDIGAVMLAKLIA